MAHFRKVYAKIWNDEKFTGMSWCGQLCFLFILTHPHMTGIGAMRATPEGLSAEIDWNSDYFQENFSQIFIDKLPKAFQSALPKAFREALPKAFREALPKAFREAFAEAFPEVFGKAFQEGFQEVLKSGLARYENHLVFLPNFSKYNKPESPNVLRSIAKVVDLLPECSLKYEVLQQFKDFAEGLGEGFAKAFREAFGEAFPKGCPQIPITLSLIRRNQKPEEETRGRNQRKKPEESSSELEKIATTTTTTTRNPESENPEIQKEAVEVVEAENNFLSEIQRCWNEMAAKNNLSVIKKLNGERKTLIAKAFGDKFWVENWKEALKKIPGSDFLLGITGNWQGAYIEWFLVPKNVLKVMEGAYANKPAGRKAGRKSLT